MRKHLDDSPTSTQSSIRGANDPTSPPDSSQSEEPSSSGGGGLSGGGLAGIAVGCVTAVAGVIGAIIRYRSYKLQKKNAAAAEAAAMAPPPAQQWGGQRPYGYY